MRTKYDDAEFQEAWEEAKRDHPWLDLPKMKAVWMDIIWEAWEAGWDDGYNAVHW